jgi:hypothetical protein
VQPPGSPPSAAPWWRRRAFALGVGVAAAIGVAVRLANVAVWRPSCDVDVMAAVADPGAYSSSGNTAGCYGLWGDAFYHFVQAQLLADGHGYVEPYGWFVSGGSRFLPGAGDPPLYPAFLALLSRLGIDTLAGVRLVGALVGLAVVVLAALLVRRLAGPRAGVLAGAVAAVYPMLWINDGMVLSESLYVPLLLVVLLAAYHFWDHPGWASAAGLGVAVAVAGLTRAEALLLYGALLLPLLWGLRRLGWARVAGFGLVAGLAGLVLVGPWVVYNLGRFSQPVTLTSATGAVLSAANCDAAYGLGPDGEYIGYAANCYDEYVRNGWLVGKLPGCDDAAVAAARVDPTGDEAARCWPNDPTFDESDRDVYSREGALRYLSEHRGRLPVVVLARVGRIWDLYTPQLGRDDEPLGQNVRLNWQVEGRGKTASRAGFLAYWALVPFAVAGLASLWRRRLPVSPLVSMAVVITVTAAFTFGITRYRVPVDLVVAVLAAVGLDALLGRWWPTGDRGGVEVKGAR